MSKLSPSRVIRNQNFAKLSRGYAEKKINGIDKKDAPL